MQYFIVPYDGGYRIVDSDGDTARYTSPWFETYSLAEKYMGRLYKRIETSNDVVAASILHKKAK